MNIGFVGLGRMGQAMVARLLEADFTVAVWNRTAAKAEPLVSQGATLAASLADLASMSDIILTIVTDDAAVEAIYNPASGLLAGPVAGKLFVEMSTIRPDTIRRIAALIHERGAALLDAPMSGTVAPAREGKLLTMVGGAPDDVEHARPVLAVLCRRIAHMGPTGSGTTMKLVLNMPMAVYWQALAEALAIGTRSGLDLAQMLDLFTDSPAAIAALQSKMPIILGETNEVSFDITGVRKDLLAMTSTGLLLGVPTPTATAALLSYAAATAASWGNRDLADLIAYYQDLVFETTSHR